MPTEPLTDNEIDHLRRAYHPSPFGTGGMVHRAVDEIETARTKLGAIRALCQERDRCATPCGWCGDGSCDVDTLRLVVDAKKLCAILDGPHV